MARIGLKSERDVDPESRAIFDEIKEKAGRVPAAYRAFANHAHILQANWNRTKRILGEGNLPIEVKEAIATRVSKVNGCHFCLHIHKNNLTNLGIDDEKIEAIASGSIADKKLSLILDFVSTATLNPHKLAKSDFKELQGMGYTEKDILEILTVMEMYTGYNKIIIALGLQLDD